MSLAVYLVKKKMRSLSSTHVANRDPLIESRIHISLSPSLPPRSLAVDRGEKLAWKLIFQNNCYSLCWVDSSVSKAFSYYSCWLSNLPAMRKYMRGAWGGHSLWPARSSRLTQTRFMVSSAEGYGRFRMFDLCDTNDTNETQMTRLLLYLQMTVFIFQVVAMEWWAELLLKPTQMNSCGWNTSLCRPCSDLCCCSVFTQTKLGYVHLRCAINVMEVSRSGDSELSRCWEM